MVEVTINETIQEMADVESTLPARGVRVAHDVDRAAVGQQVIKFRPIGELVDPRGTIAIMSSGQGSITNNERGGFEIYRASKSALNQLMRSYDARHRDSSRTLLLMAPGWVKTELGGPNAPLTISESIPNLVTTIDNQRGHIGLRYLDYRGQTVAW